MNLRCTKKFGSLSTPPVAVVRGKYHFTVVFQHVRQVGCDEPSFEDIGILIEVLQFIPETFIMFHEFFYDEILVVENQVVHNLLCCHII